MKRKSVKRFFFFFPASIFGRDHVLLPVGVDPEVVAVDGGVEVVVLQLLSCTFLGNFCEKVLGRVAVGSLCISKNLK